MSPRVPLQPFGFAFLRAIPRADPPSPRVVPLPSPPSIPHPTSPPPTSNFDILWQSGVMNKYVRHIGVMYKYVPYLGWGLIRNPQVAKKQKKGKEQQKDLGFAGEKA